jgi:integrase
MRDGLTKDEYKAFRDAMPTWRDRLICMALRNTGLRINELLKIEERHTSLGYGGPTYIIYVQRSKKRNNIEYEPIYLSAGLGVELVEWIRAHKIEPTERIFGNISSSHGRDKITDRGLRHVFADVGRKVLGRPIMPKELRRLFIQDLVDGGAPIEVAAKMVGHENIRTTQAHYYQLTSDRRQYIGERIEV